MVKVLDISTKEHLFITQFKNPDADTKKCLELLSAKELLSVLPANPEYTIRFTLDDANSQIANALRRVLVDEIPTYAMTFNLMLNENNKPADFINCLRTDDKFIFGKCDNLLKRIEAIRIKQNINPTDWKISLEIKNDTTELIDIYSSHFKIIYKGKQVNVEQLMHPTYILMRLRPHKFLKINNIRIVQGLSMDDANKFKYLANVHYDIFEKPFEKINGKFVGRSCMESDYKKFFIGYTTYRNIIRPYEPIKNACQILIDRINVILVEWNKIKKNEPSDRISKYQIGEIHVISINGESYTMANLLYYYIYMELPSIDFATGGIKHIEKNISIIKIKHKNYWDILSNASKKIIKDLEIIDKSFSK